MNFEIISIAIYLLSIHVIIEISHSKHKYYISINYSSMTSEVLKQYVMNISYIKKCNYFVNSKFFLIRRTPEYLSVERNQYY